MDIHLTDKTSVRKRLWFYPKNVAWQINDLLNKKWIINLQSPYSSPIVVVRKKRWIITTLLRLPQTEHKDIPEWHPLRRIQHKIGNLGGNQFFSLLDQSTAYHQLQLDLTSRKYTAFITPFDLLNTPACSQRFMEHCLEAYRYKLAVPYLNDLLIYSW